MSDVTPNAEMPECLIGDTEWHQTFMDAGYLCCTRCGEHHRHPETCGQDETIVFFEGEWEEAPEW